MIIVRAPLRISFVGGGTDLPDFYHQYPGRVISTTINKFVYLVINPAYHMDDFILKYQVTEKVKHPKDIAHDRFRAALLDLGITDRGVEIGSFADIPAKTGLGSSSSFTVALIKGLDTFLGKSISPEEAAREACRLEIDVLKEPIGKQDQYASAYGGFNIFQFNPDETVDIEPVLVDSKKKRSFEDHLLLFYTGITRNASSVLTDQKTKITDNLETYKQMSDSVYQFRDNLLLGDYKALGQMLHEGWVKKRSLGSAVTNSMIDDMYELGIKGGAWGGKVLGAGGGGCLLFIAPPDAHEHIEQSLARFAADHEMLDSQEINFAFTQSGASVIFNSNR